MVYQFRKCVLSLVRCTNLSRIAAMITALVFLPLFVGLSVVLTVVVADLLSPETKESKSGANKLGGKRVTAA
jgi:membrane protein implicated in regulation of membrane protease activity